MKNLETVHEQALQILNQQMTLSAVSLKYPFPERPARALGLVKLDGKVFCTDKIQRLVLFTMRPPFYLKVYSTFIRPKIEYDLPVFSSEVVCMGGKKMFLVDAHKAGAAGENDFAAFFDKLVLIRQGYPDLLKYQKVTGKGIQSVFSKAVCQVTIPPEMDEQALEVFAAYLNAYLDLIKSAKPLEGPALEKTRKEFEAYLQTVVEHDPGVKGNIMLFGKSGGVERALDIFYGM